MAIYGLFMRLFSTWIKPFIFASLCMIGVQNASAAALESSSNKLVSNRANSATRFDTLAVPRSIEEEILVQAIAPYRPIPALLSTIQTPCRLYSFDADEASKCHFQIAMLKKQWFEHIHKMTDFYTLKTQVLLHYSDRLHRDFKVAAASGFKVPSHWSVTRNAHYDLLWQTPSPDTKGETLSPEMKAVMELSDHADSAARLQNRFHQTERDLIADRQALEWALDSGLASWKKHPDTQDALKGFDHFAAAYRQSMELIDEDLITVGQLWAQE